MGPKGLTRRPRGGMMDPSETNREFDRQRVVEYELPGGWRVVAGRTDALARRSSAYIRNT